MVPLSDIEPLPAELPLWTGATQQPSVTTGNLRLLPITSMGLESYETTRSKQSIQHLPVPTKGLQKNSHALDIGSCCWSLPQSEKDLQHFKV